MQLCMVSMTIIVEHDAVFSSSLQLPYSVMAAWRSLLGSQHLSLTTILPQPSSCLQQKNGKCPRGMDCPLSHTVFERWLHPQR